MDDILASIRRILNEDDAAAHAPPAAGSDVFPLDASMLVQEPQSPVKLVQGPMPAAPDARPEPRVDMRAPPEPPDAASSLPQEPSLDPSPDSTFPDSPFSETPPAGSPPPAEPSVAHGVSAPFVTPPSVPSHAITASEHPLATPVAQGDPVPPSWPAPLVAPEAAAAAALSVGSLKRTLEAGRSSMAVRAGGPTLDEMVREELRPILKAWLDAHLPPIVERAVRAEIERVVGRADL